MRYDRVYKQQSAWRFTCEHKIGCLLYTVSDYTHLSCAQLCVCTKHYRKYPRGTRLCILQAQMSPYKIFHFEQAVPYQSAVVFDVLVCQVCNGGCNAGAEELLPLVKVALMDFI